LDKVTAILRKFLALTLLSLFFLIIRYGMSWQNPVFIVFQYLGQIVTGWGMALFAIEILKSFIKSGKS
jgi:hypothetical protein